MGQATIVIPPSFLKALVAHVSFQGVCHGKTIVVEDGDELCPNTDYGQKSIDFLQDSNTTCYAVTRDGVIYRMAGEGAFRQAWRDGIRFAYALTLPSGLDSWQDFGALPHELINKTYAPD